MTTPVSGAISFLDLANEYQGPYGFQRYALSMADVYNSANLVIGTVAVTTSVSIGGGNIITWSERFNIAPWTAFNASVSADQIVAPDGNTTAEKILVTGLGGGSYIQQDDVKTLKAGVQYTHSVYLRGDGTSVGRLCAIGNFDNGARVGQTSLTLTANWQRLSATFTGSASSNRNIFIQPNGVAGSNVAVGEAVFAWGYQITTGSTLRAYVQTTDQIVPEPFAISNTGAFVNTTVAAQGAISMSQFYGITGPASGVPGGRTTITITVPATTYTSNLNLYNIALRSGYTTGLTDVVLNVGTGAIVGSVGSSITDSFSVSLASGSGAYTRGNLVNNSQNMSDGAFWQWGPFNRVDTSFPVTYGIISPNGTTTGVIALWMNNVSTNDYFQQTQTLLNATTAYCVSIWLKGWGTSIGLRISAGTAQTQSSIILTASWQRLVCNVNNTGGQRFLLYTNGGSQMASNSGMQRDQTIFAWGPMITTSVGTGAAAVNQQYVETTSAGYIHFSPPTLTGSYNIYTTSETLTTSYAVSVPSRFNSGDTVRIVNNGSIVGASGRGGQAGTPVTVPALGNPVSPVGRPGGRGGDALGVFRPVTIDNIGVIGGGGGGGGGGSSGPSNTPKGGVSSAGGGAGGGGAGADPNSGYFDYAVIGMPVPSPGATFTLGTPPAQASFTAGVGGARVAATNATGTAGANGGALGTTGNTSLASPTGAAQPGGGPGHYVVGSPLVTWVNTGTRSGTVG
jgi:hypothetical protein